MGIGYRTHREGGNLPLFLGNNYRISEIQGAILRVQLAKLDGRLNRMKRNSAMLEEVLKTAGVPLARRNDPDETLSVACTFSTEDDAIDFAEKRGVRRLFDNSKHIYTRWSPILAQRMHHVAFDPWSWAGIPFDQQRNDCPRTLDLLRRSCAVNLVASLPYPAAKMLARRLVA